MRPENGVQIIDKHPGIVKEEQLRTFQRRIKQWRIQHGTNQEVFLNKKNKNFNIYICPCVKENEYRNFLILKNFLSSS